MQAFLILIFFTLLSCNQAGNQAVGLTSHAMKSQTLKPIKKVGEDKVDSEDPRQSYRPLMVSAFDLDDPKFTLTGLSVGMKDFVSAQSPAITYVIPKEADYIEMIRCPADARISSGIDVIDLNEIELMTSSIDERSDIYRANDFFRAAGDTSGCEQITTGIIGNEYIDSYCPTGSYRYLVRTCVAEVRLSDSSQLTSRNCSKRVAISPEFTHQNLRKEQELRALRKAGSYKSQVDQVLSSIKFAAEEYAFEIEQCTAFEHARKVKSQQKEAWVTLVAVIADVSLEFGMYKMVGSTGGKSTSILRHYFSPSLKPGKMADRFGLMGALGGMTFKDVLMKVATSKEDISQSCHKLDEINNRTQLLIQELSMQTYWYAYWIYLAEAIHEGLDAMDPNTITPAPEPF